MPIRHILLLVLVAVLWGGNSVVIKFGVQHTPPFALASLRFLCAALPAVWLVARPAANWRQLMGIGATIGVLMSAFQFLGLRLGAPAGATTIVLQSQVFFTTLLATVLLGERWSHYTLLSTVLGAAGLLCCLLPQWHSATLSGLLCEVVAAFFWACGNLVIKRSAKSDGLSLMAWMSLVPIVPLALASTLWEAGSQTGYVYSFTTLSGWATALYLGLGVTLIGYGIWGKMLQRYPAQLVAPYSMLVPVFGVLFSAMVFGESLSGLQSVGLMLLVSAILINTRAPSQSA